MDAAVDVLVTVQDVKAFRGLLSSLDVQTLPTDSYRVVAVADGLDGASRDLLGQLAAHRPNVVVADGAATLGGTRSTLPVHEAERLAPDALETLLAAARDTGAGVVLGKAVTPATDWTVFGSDRVVPGVDLAGVDVAGLPVLITGGAPGAGRVADVRRAAVDASGEVAVLASRVVLAAEGPVEEAPDAVEHRDVDVAWRDGVLELHTAEGGVVRAVLRSLVLGEQWAVPAADEAGTLVRIDLRTVSLGRPLSAGPWLIDLHLDQRGAHPVAAVPTATTRSALLELVPGTGSLVVLGRRHSQLVIDIGGGRWLPRRLFRPDAARISESARGTLLEWPLEVEDFTVEARIDAGLRLGGLPVAAELVHTDGGPVLRAWLSGLPGVASVAVRVGGSEWHPTRTQLVIANAGGMSLRTRKREAEQEGAGSDDELDTSPEDTASGPARIARGAARRLRSGGSR